MKTCRFAGIMAVVLAVPMFADGRAEAQQAVLVAPGKAYSTDASGTITTTNTFQTIWSAVTGAPLRRGCLIVNTSTDEQWVYFGADTDTPTKAKAVPLEPAAATARLGGWTSCTMSGGITLQDHVWITGTAADTFVAKRQ